LHGALGVKRYILGGVVFFVIGIYESLRAWLPRYGIELPRLPTWQIAILIVLLLLVWWLIQRLVAVEKELEPNLEILFGDGPPYEITEPMNAEGHAQRFFRVKVENTSTKDLDNCLVMLEEMKTAQGQTYPNRYIPVGLSTDHQLLQKRRRGVFKLRGKQWKFIVVACLDEKVADSEIAFLYENEKYPNTVPRNNYQITLVAYGGGVPKRKQFNISVDDRGFLKMSGRKVAECLA
jgi:hypothetical protein